jgi:hypothetical protein
MSYLLESDHLQCLSENDVFVFFSAWAQEQDAAAVTKQQLPSLVRQLRFQHMDQHFLGHVVAYDKLLEDAGLLPYVMQRALGRRGLDADPADEGWGERASNRGAAPEDATWTYTTSIALADCLVLDEPWCSSVEVPLGLAAGYQLALSAYRTAAGNGLCISVSRDPYGGCGFFVWEWCCPFELLLQGRRRDGLREGAVAGCAGVHVGRGGAGGQPPVPRWEDGRGGHGPAPHQVVRRGWIGRESSGWGGIET